MHRNHISLSSEAMQCLERAYAFEERNEFEWALEECDAAIRIDPGLAEAHNLRGMILDESGRKKEAIPAYREAVRLDPSFQEARENLQDIENELTEGGSRSPSMEVGCTLIGGNQELNDYVLHAGGLGRTGLNIMCFIGVFIFGWLLTVAFDMLGKKRQGWFYVGPILACLVISRLIEPAIGILAPIIYVIGWIHANVVLSNYQSDARDRIAQIDRLSGDQVTVNAMMEKGILQRKVLADGEAATATLQQALQLPGGDAQLLNLAGVMLFANKRYPEAQMFFGRALSVATDEVLIKQVKRNQVNVEKKIK